MIAGSLLFILLAIVLLGLGLIQGSNTFLVGSIAASMLAAIALVVAGRGVSTAEVDPLGQTGEHGEAEPEASLPAAAPLVAAQAAVPVDLARVDVAAAPRETVDAAIPTQASPLTKADDEADPPGEPQAQQLSAADTAALAGLTAEVRVVDGRPRYHLPGCAFLKDRDSEALPVSEAVELGFNACADCAAATTLLTEVPR